MGVWGWGGALAAPVLLPFTPWHRGACFGGQVGVHPMSPGPALRSSRCPSAPARLPRDHRSRGSRPRGSRRCPARAASTPVPLSLL